MTTHNVDKLACTQACCRFTITPMLCTVKNAVLVLLLCLPLSGLAQTTANTTVSDNSLQAQSPDQSLATPLTPNLTGTWEGELVRGRENMTLAFTFALQEGNYTATITSSALGIFGMPAESVVVDGLKVNIKIARLDLEFYGMLRLNAAGTVVERIDGDYYQSSEMVPVVLRSVANASF